MVLCCDGTLIGFVHLDGDEIPAVKEVMDIEEADGQDFFSIPARSIVMAVLFTIKDLDNAASLSVDF